MGEEKGLVVSFLTLPVARTYLHLVGHQTISFLSCLGNVSDTQKLGKYNTFAIVEFFQLSRGWKEICKFSLVIVGFDQK